MEPPHTCLCADIVENQARPGLHRLRPLRRWRVARLERCRSPLSSRITHRLRATLLRRQDRPQWTSREQAVHRVGCGAVSRPGDDDRFDARRGIRMGGARATASQTCGQAKGSAVRLERTATCARHRVQGVHFYEPPRQRPSGQRPTLTRRAHGDARTAINPLRRPTLERKDHGQQPPTQHRPRQDPAAAAAVEVRAEPDPGPVQLAPCCEGQGRRVRHDGRPAPVPVSRVRDAAAQLDQDLQARPAVAQRPACRCLDDDLAPTGRGRRVGCVIAAEVPQHDEDLHPHGSASRSW